MFAHWGTFTRDGSLNAMLGFAQDALNSKGYETFDRSDDGDFIVVGRGEGAIVAITCVPLSDESTWCSVFACSDNNDAAAFARSDIRQFMETGMNL